MDKLKALLKYVWQNLEFVIAALLLIIMVSALFAQVVFRFVLSNPIGWSEELAVLCFVMMVYIGAIGATKNEDHLRLELIVNLMNAKGKCIFNIISNVLFMIVNLIITYSIFTVALNLQKYGMRTAMLGFPKWIAYMVLPVCFLLMTYRLIQNTIKEGKKIKTLNASKQ